MQSTSTYSRRVNGSRSILHRIGTVTTTAPKEHRVSYETASAYTIVEVPAGTYDVVAIEEFGRIAWVMVRYEGIVTDDHYVNRLGAASSLAPKRGIGEQRSCSAQLYDYIAARCFVEDGAWSLADDWKVVMSERDTSDGRRHKSLRLVKPDNVEVIDPELAES